MMITVIGDYLADNDDDVDEVEDGVVDDEVEEDDDEVDEVEDDDNPPDTTSSLKVVLDEATGSWGIKVERVEM